MADVHNKATRSFNMSRIKGKNTKPELKISEAKCWWGADASGITCL
ncbi:hypothetical protein [Mariniphaga sp.]